MVSHGRSLHSVNAFMSLFQPMLSHVRVHPLLVTATKEKELLRERSAFSLLSLIIFMISNCKNCLAAGEKCRFARIIAKFYL